MPIGQFGVDGCHLIDGGQAQCGLGDHQGSRQGCTGAARNIGAGVLVSCDHVGDNTCCWDIER